MHQYNEKAIQEVFYFPAIGRAYIIINYNTTLFSFRFYLIFIELFSLYHLHANCIWYNNGVSPYQSWQINHFETNYYDRSPGKLCNIPRSLIFENLGSPSSKSLFHFYAQCMHVLCNWYNFATLKCPSISFKTGVNLNEYDKKWYGNGKRLYAVTNNIGTNIQ